MFPLMFLIAAHAAHPATPRSAVPDYITAICMPFVRDGIVPDAARGRIVAAGLRALPISTGSHMQRFTNKRYEIQLGMDQKEHRWCNAYDLLADTRPMFAAGKVIVAQNPSLKLMISNALLGFWRWDSDTMTFEVRESGNDFAPDDRIMPGIEVSSLKLDD
jgi:hypothetical protein